MNYTLTINLEGADKVNDVLDKLIKSTGSIATPKISFDKWLSAGDGEDVGEKIGKNIQSGIKKTLTLSSLKGLMKFWNDGIKNAESQNQKSDWKKILIGAGLGFTNPYIGSRLLSDELGKGGGAGGVSGGLFGKGGIAGFSEIYLAFKGFKIAVDTFRHIVESALEKAFNIYTQAAQAGLNTQFFTQRQALAGLLGVSGNPNQIFMFGKAVQELSERSAFATRTIAGNSRALFNTSVNFKLLKLDTEALYSEIASKLAPAINLAVIGIDYLVKGLTKMISAIVGVLKFELEVLSHLPGGGGAWAARILLGLSNLVTKSTELSPIMSGMKQLPASSWEHMGLAIGSMSNPQTQILKDSRNYLKTIATAVVQAGHGVPRSFGLDPQTSNP